MTERRAQDSGQDGEPKASAARWRPARGTLLRSAASTLVMTALGVLFLECRPDSALAGPEHGMEPYFTLGNVGLYRTAPEVLIVRSGITDVQYGVLIPFGAAVIVALVSTIAYVWGRRKRRRADWALPIGSAIVAGMLGFVGWGTATIQTTIDQEARTVQIEQLRLWGAVPRSAQLSFDQVDDVRIFYRAGRGAHCSAVLRKKPDDGSELPLFRFVDVLTDRLDLAQCEHLRHRLAQALQTDARDDPEQRQWW